MDLRPASERTKALEQLQSFSDADSVRTHVTREVSLDVEYGGRAKDPWGNERIGFVATTSLDRKDFGLGWNQLLEAGGVLVGDHVDVELEVQAVKAAAAKAA